MFRHWAQPVVSQPWAVIATVLFALAKWTNNDWLHHVKHSAWQRACGLNVDEP